MASLEEYWQPVTHKQGDCPVCQDMNLIMDIPKPRNSFDKLMIAIRNNNARLRILQGKRIEVKGE